MMTGIACHSASFFVFFFFSSRRRHTRYWRDWSSDVCSSDLSGTSDGFEAFCKGDTVISDASRPIDVAEEVPVCEENGVEYIEIPVAFDGISVVVNSENDWASEITSEELKTIWEPAAEGQITSWNQVRSEWPDNELSLYGPGTESGTYEFFNETIVQNEEEVNRSDYEASEDDNVLVQGVSGDQNALGYFGY